MTSQIDTTKVQRPEVGRVSVNEDELHCSGHRAYILKKSH
jgi:hypothetical protein